jgi:hypothetical protein
MTQHRAQPPMSNLKFNLWSATTAGRIPATGQLDLLISSRDSQLLLYPTTRCRSSRGYSRINSSSIDRTSIWRLRVTWLPTTISISFRTKFWFQQRFQRTTTCTILKQLSKAINWFLSNRRRRTLGWPSSKYQWCRRTMISISSSSICRIRWTHCSLMFLSLSTCEICSDCSSIESHVCICIEEPLRQSPSFIDRLIFTLKILFLTNHFIF